MWCPTECVKKPSSDKINIRGHTCFFHGISVIVTIILYMDTNTSSTQKFIVRCSLTYLFVEGEQMLISHNFVSGKEMRSSPADSAPKARRIMLTFPIEEKEYF